MILVLDNYDSFTFNLVQLLGELGGEIRVARNDEISLNEIRALTPQGIVVSPGPCTPQEAGVSIEVIRELGPATPLLGVCLGHQAIGEAFGGSTIRASRVMHGKTDSIRHTGEGPFTGLPNPLQVTRYHSLVTDPHRLPGELEPLAWSGDGEIQGMRHKTFPIWGVQFHPESLFSQEGKGLLANFLRQTIG